MKCLPSAGTAILTEENEKISLTQGPSWSEQSSAIAIIQAVFNKSGKLLAVQSEGDFRGQLMEGLHKAANDAKNNFELFELAVTKRFTIHNTA